MNMNDAAQKYFEQINNNQAEKQTDSTSELLL